MARYFLPALVCTLTGRGDLVKEVLILLVSYFMLVFFVVFLTTLGYNIAISIVNNILGVIL